MKKAILFLVLAGLPVAASASGLRMTIEQPRFTCQGDASHFSHVAYLPEASDSQLLSVDGDGSAPLPCCDGKLGCAQFLSTNTVIRQATQWHG